MAENQIQIPLPEFNDQIHKWQLEILRNFDNKTARFFQLRWHRRARKTTLLLNILIKEACTHAGKVYGYIAPTYRQAKAIVWRDPNMLDRYLPQEYVKRKNESELFVEFKNKSILAIKGGDDPDSIRGLDFEGVGLDEWALIKKDIWESILRPIIAQSKDRWAIFAFTPKGQNHAYDYWQNESPDWYRSFLPVSKSGLIDKDELAKARLDMPEHLFEQEFECSFEVEEDSFILIPLRHIEELKNINFAETIVGDVIANDPSAGGDECATYVLKNLHIKESKFIYEKDTMKVAGELMVLSARHNINNFAIDNIGVGKGICDRLGELRKNVMEIKSAESASNKNQFYNRRTEMWWYVMKLVMDKALPYPDDKELRRQLGSVKYKVVSSNGQVALEPKLDTKKRLGRSPDRADAFVYGIWATQFMNPRNQIFKPYNYRTGKVEIKPVRYI